MNDKDISFYIPTKRKGIVKVNNFIRTYKLLESDNYIGLNDLNKLDYLFETAILLNVKKINKHNQEKNDSLYSLIEEVNFLANDIYLLELKRLDIEFDNNLSNLNEDDILKRSGRIASTCLEEKSFDNMKNIIKNWRTNN